MSLDSANYWSPIHGQIFGCSQCNMDGSGRVCRNWCNGKTTNKPRDSKIVHFRCVSIASTETLKLGEKSSISIGKCDFGPIYYEIQHNQHPGPLQDFANNVGCLWLKGQVINPCFGFDSRLFTSLLSPMMFWMLLIQLVIYISMKHTLLLRLIC